MAQVARGQQGIGLFASDGERHTTQDILIGLTVMLGGIALVTSLFRDLHVLASWTGLVGIVTGAWGQMISATTRERFVVIIALGAAALGFFLGMARGGLLGGIVG
ncbi:hypothetical protein [Streptomyces boninensis]|uniref:hypothetical protein n=1 Tax=Streptomyces boninensis TaxID=2039455 RepID=UPI003B211E81